MSKEAGKGDTPRPVDGYRYRDNWERAFRKAPKKQSEKTKPTKKHEN